MKAKDFCDKVFDGTHDTPKPVSNGKLLITSKHIANRCLDTTSAYYISEDDYNNINKRSRVQQYDVLFSMIGTVGNVYIERSKNIDYAIKNMGVFSCGDRDRALWLYYYLQSPKVKMIINSYLSGAVQKFVPLDFLRNLDIPDYSRQCKSIINVLTALDDKIALNKRINDKLEAMAKRLYDYWFVQFDFPDENGRPYKSSGGKMVWNETLKREIPEGWEVKRLGEVCSFRNGINYDKSVLGNKKYKIINVRNMTASSLFLNQNDFDEICLPSSLADGYIIHDNTVLIARSGSPGATRIINSVEADVIFCGFIICMENFDKRYKMYFAYNLKSLENTNATKTGGSILQNVSQDTLKRIFMVIPPAEIINSFNRYISTNIKECDLITKQSDELNSIRDRLLPLLMNSQVVVEGEI